MTLSAPGKHRVVLQHVWVHPDVPRASPALRPGLLMISAEGVIVSNETRVRRFIASFVGSTLETPGDVSLVMDWGGMDRVARMVEDPERFGDRFGPEWVLQFFKDLTEIL